MDVSGTKKGRFSVAVRVVPLGCGLRQYPALFPILSGSSGLHTCHESRTLWVWRSLDVGPMVYSSVGSEEVGVTPELL